jgi:ribonucleoside-triphosphate reductase
MNEAMENFMGKNLGTKEGKDFALKVMDYLRTRLIEIQEETLNNYNLEATPAEGTSYRLAILDKKTYPEIKCANCGSDTPFYTNSTQLPVNFSDDIFEVLDLQDELQTKYTGGTVLHIFGGERVEHGNSIKALVKSVCEGYHLPYFTFSPTFSICPEHGYLDGEQPVCPTCQKDTEVFSRIVGYLRPVSQWNDGKKAEFKLRTTFDTLKQHESKHIPNTDSQLA